MVFVKKTFSYLKKSFLILLVAALAPAIVLGLFVQPFAGLTFLPSYIATNITTFNNFGFADIFFMIFSKNALTLVFPYLLGFFAFIVSCSYSLSIMEKHFKTGKLLLRNLVRSVNNSLLSVLKIVPLAIFIIVVVLLIQTGITSLLQLIVTNPASPKLLDYIWPVLIAIIFYLIIVTLTVFFGVWVVITQIFGFSFGDAFVESIRTVTKRLLPFIGGFLLPATIMLLPTIILDILLNINMPVAMHDSLLVVRAVVDIAAFALIIVYFSAYIMVSVYALTGLERRDEKSFVPKKYIANNSATTKKNK